MILETEAALLLPPTLDRRSLFARLETLSIGELGDGTSLGMGIAIAAIHIKNSAAPRKAVVLITDGENNAGAIHPETAAEVLPKLGSSLWVIGVGSGGEFPLITWTHSPSCAGWEPLIPGLIRIRLKP